MQPIDFYIFLDFEKCTHMDKENIKLCMPRTCIACRKKHTRIFFSIQRLHLKKNVYVKWQISNQLLFFDLLWAWFTCDIRSNRTSSQDFKLYAVILRRLFTCLFINDISSK